MSEVHQIYCTHCKTGSSALERPELRQGAAADRVVGYSARAGSLIKPQELRKYYRQIERFMYYYLPKDTPGDEKQRLTADSAPHRFVFCPSINGLQCLGQICYRPKDTQGRVGSYFGHFLFNENADSQDAWSQLECLQLWGAAQWVTEDSRDIPCLLPPLSSLVQMLNGHRRAIDDDVLLSFLTTPAGGSMNDPIGVVPARWQNKSPQERCDLLIKALQGFLDVQGQPDSQKRHDSLLLVIEPSMAALVFYGILRLLPPDLFRDRVSFSTFEPNPARLSTTLAATTFYHPEKIDLPREVIRSRGFHIHTFRNKSSELRHPDAIYARHLVGLLVHQGWSAVDRMLSLFQSKRSTTLVDLEELAKIDQMGENLLRPNAPLPEGSWRASQIATSYLRQAISQRISQKEQGLHRLDALVGTPAHLFILELLAGDQEPSNTQDAVRYLLERLPDGQIAALLKFENVSVRFKVSVLANYIKKHGDFPPNCEHLWRVTSAKAITALVTSQSVLPQLLARLEENEMDRLYCSVQDRFREPFLMSLMGACRLNPAKHEALSKIIAATGPREIEALLLRLDAAFYQNYPDGEPELAKSLHKILHDLPLDPARFSERLDLLLKARDCLSESDHHTVQSWQSCRTALLEIGDLINQYKGRLKRRTIAEFEPAGQRLAQACCEALPQSLYPDDKQGTKKQECLKRLGQQLLGVDQFLHPDVWLKISWFFELGDWSKVSITQIRNQPRTGKLQRILWTLTAAMAVLTCIIFAALWVRHNQAKKNRPAKNKTTVKAVVPQESKTKNPDIEVTGTQGSKTQVGKPLAKQNIIPDDQRAKKQPLEVIGPKGRLPDGHLPNGQIPDKTAKAAKLESKTRRTDPKGSKSPKPSQKAEISAPPAPKPPQLVTAGPLLDAIPPVPENSKSPGKNPVTILQIIKSQRDYRLKLAGLEQVNRRLSQPGADPSNRLSAEYLADRNQLKLYWGQKKSTNELAKFYFTRDGLRFKWEYRRWAIKYQKAFGSNCVLVVKGPDDQTRYYSLLTPIIRPTLQIENRKVIIPADGLPPQMDPKQLFLGQGKLVFKDGISASLTTKPLATQQQIPEMAKALELDSVSVRLQPEGKNLVLRFWAEATNGEQEAQRQLLYESFNRNCRVHAVLYRVVDKKIQVEVMRIGKP